MAAEEVAERGWPDHGGGGGREGLPSHENFALTKHRGGGGEVGKP